VSGEPMENGLDWTKSDGEDMATPNRPRLWQNVARCCFPDSFETLSISLSESMSKIRLCLSRNGRRIDSMKFDTTFKKQWKLHDQGDSVQFLWKKLIKMRKSSLTEIPWAGAALNSAAIRIGS
jgi:hypothetical protein